MITNAIIGYVIVLAAWLVVDTVMKMLLSQDQLGTWNAIQCVPQPEARVVVRSSQDVIDAYGSSSAATLANVSTFIQGDCSPESLEAAGFDTTQAQTFSCILKYESTCNLAAQNPWSSARGLFQIVRGLDTVCHNLNLPECTSAAQSAGYSVSGNLDCSTAFSGGTGPKDPSRATPGMEDLYNACNAAIVDLDCSVAAAKCLYDGRAPGNAGYGPWLGNPGQNHHLNQRACVQKYAD